jgi:hypothetical protein
MNSHYIKRMIRFFVSAGFCILLLLPRQSGAQSYVGPVAKPATGYGSDGPHTISSVSFANPYWPAHDLVIYHPSDISTPVPTIFYNHAYGGFDPSTTMGIFKFIVGKGYAVVFSPYPTVAPSPQSRYADLDSGFIWAVKNYPTIIDTSKVGFMGWSFGGGAAFANAYEAFTVQNWGQQGRFIFSLAPYYFFNISQPQLVAFPVNTKILIK